MNYHLPLIVKSEQSIFIDWMNGLASNSKNIIEVDWKVKYHISLNKHLGSYLEIGPLGGGNYLKEAIIEKLLSHEII